MTGREENQKEKKSILGNYKLSLHEGQGPVKRSEKQQEYPASKHTRLARLRENQHNRGISAKLFCFSLEACAGSPAQKPVLMERVFRSFKVR